MAQSGNVLIDFTKWVFKWMAIVIAMLTCAGLVAMIAYSWWTHDRFFSAVSIRVDRDIKTPDGKLACNVDFPLFVSITNKSSRAVVNSQFEVSAHLPGHSDDITTGWALVRLDNVIPPGGAYAQCYRIHTEG